MSGDTTEHKCIQGLCNDHAGEKPRANRDGHPCPPWCTSEHDDGVIGHYGDYMASASLRLGAVKASWFPGQPIEVRLDGPEGQVLLCPEHADRLAGVLEALPSTVSPVDLAAQLRAAAAIVRDTK